MDIGRLTSTRVVPAGGRFRALTARPDHGHAVRGELDRLASGGSRAARIHWDYWGTHIQDTLKFFGGVLGL